MRNAIYFLGILYMLLANKRKQKTAKNRLLAFFKAKIYFAKKPQKSFKSRIKMAHSVTIGKNYYFAGNFA